MRSVCSRRRRARRRGTRRPATYLILARIHDHGIATLASRFTEITPARSGETRAPHVTLFGPFGLPAGSPDSILLDRIREAASGTEAVTCMIGDPLWLRGRKGMAITLSLAPDTNMVGLYRKLVTALSPETAWCTWIDRPPGSRIFHISLRVSISRSEIHAVRSRVREALQTGREYREGGVAPAIHADGCSSPLTLFRMALLRRGSLWKELDLVRGTWLSRAEAFNPDLWVITRREYRISQGLQLTGPVYRTTPGIFVISDLHFGHTNIIRYCHRPFSSVIEMDTVLLDNWNFTVRPDDLVIYLGDLRYGRGAPPADHFLNRLQGNITSIIGNHDDPLPGAVPSLMVTCQDIPFLCIHNPGEVPEDSHGWVIHGHIHNNDLERYPFINGEQRTINVSAELVKYAPVSLDEIASFVRAIRPGEKAATLDEARRLRDSRPG
ncbi:MAG TPA: 2'-5' RNA ligase family protein [Methanoregulaceae archaeon]|mgnify:CR=1 FL=1|nr:MAG: 2'-5' RNA ligase family protein [Methanolinea sp.]HON81094.1 2'-5' RNA ligase family protein [Methanoregulaceae archaeon]HPD09962.1 2'-5' RNA ligase family protein [Methanoregulaceae archaeon]HRT14847.1 2'-5' RNA ligase family protein [Methanoregulaceae archaeon]HRU30538.1 2'-5' RNA ligase family protein [Methanoregulaceae archaeon]